MLWLRSVARQYTFCDLQGFGCGKRVIHQPKNPVDVFKHSQVAHTRNEQFQPIYGSKTPRSDEVFVKIECGIEMRQIQERYYAPTIFPESLTIVEFHWVPIEIQEKGSEWIKISIILGEVLGFARWCFNVASLILAVLFFTS